jgi:hypothetical protein
LPLLLSLLFAAGTAFSQEQPARDFFTVTLENDLFAGKDGGYTNGFGVTWAHGGLGEFNGENLPRWLHALSRDLYISTLPGRHRAVSYRIGQAMQTPGEITVPTLIEDEAPYVGMLAWSASLHAFDDRVADKLTLMLGVVGPASGAKATQRLVHKLIDADKPKGWSNQIDNEVVFQVSAERLWRLADVPFAGGTGFDLIGITRGAAGTAKSGVAGGLGLRYGRDLDRSFPAATVLPGREVNPLAGSVAGSWNLFFNLLGEFVANDIGVDGNTFKSSHSVPLEHWQAQAVAGVAFNLERWAFLLSAVAATDRYEGQPETTRFGSLSVTYNY